MENENKQQQQQEFSKSQEQSQQQVRVCKKCGATLGEEDKFCPECGEEYGGVERTCRICKTVTTSEFCPECGNRVIPLVCPDCKAESYYDFCENCGKPLTPNAQQMVEAPAPQQQEIKEMTQAEAEEVKKAFENFVTPELESFQKKIREHQILKQEKEYFNNREKRIKKVFGAHPYEIEFPDLDDEIFKQKAYQGLKAAVIHREKEELEAKMAAWQKEQDALEAKREAEARERIRKEVEAEFAKRVVGVDQALKDEQHRLDEMERRRKEEEERRRREEEERKRREEAERKRQEEERKRREEECRRREEAERKRREAEERRRLAEDAKYSGKYFCSDERGWWNYLIVTKRGNSIEVYDKTHYFWGEENYSKMKATLQGRKIILHEDIIISGTIDDDAYTDFCGEFSELGQCILGYWYKGNSRMGWNNYRKC